MLVNDTIEDSKKIDKIYLCLQISDKSEDRKHIARRSTMMRPPTVEQPFTSLRDPFSVTIIILQ